MNLLAFETSSRLGSVALETAAGVTVRELGAPREQTEGLLAMTDELLAAAGIDLTNLDGIAFGRGPGSFTGLRVSVAVAQGFSVASGVPLLPVSSLLCLAERAWHEAPFERALVCVDAHMGEVYWAYAARHAGAVEIVGDERLGAPADVAAPGATPWCAVGNGFVAHADALGPLMRA
ncbi:MAG TPA: tRNA (adenosine(37)-N6)-threonylcarbamoyltransferase complex dimerization subunit type 1 TsaB, partial [Gammaproteobacteria bacterium]|nr:tRNA (adenosine(37)-N6)-threonylcarbamoyltransferase complex dimerization subunit type 1 TsaB [Gammaproteobacteria bacterium]